MANGMNSDLEIEFKRSIIHKIKEYPVLWSRNSRQQGVYQKDLRASWDDVQAALDFPLRRVKLLWASFRRHYFDILMRRTINQDKNLPRWKLFHDMSFLYETMKEIIAEKMGGISPPLFKPQPILANSASRVACPCCLPLSDENVSSPTEFRIGSPHTHAQSEQTPPIEIYELSDPDDFNQDQTTNSFEEHLSEDSLCESSEIVILKENSPSQLTQTTSLQAPLYEGSSNQPNQISFVNESLPRNTVYQLIHTNSFQTLQPDNSIVQSGQSILLQDQLSEQTFGQIMQSNQTIIYQEPLSQESLNQMIQNNAIQFSQPIFYQEPLPESNQTNVLRQPLSSQTQVTQGQSVKRASKPKFYVPRKVLSVDREKIINAIRLHPVLYIKTPYRKAHPTQTWKAVAAEVGLQVHTVKNRWKLIKQRFVDEMMRERYSDGPYKSSWKSFDKMSFMREFLQEEVDEIDRMRDQIQTLVKDKRSRQSIDLCSDDDDTDDASQKLRKTERDQCAPSMELLEQNQIPEITTLDLTSEEFENSDSHDADKGLTNSYQGAFERSIVSIKFVPVNDDDQCERSNDQPTVATNIDNTSCKDDQVIELDLSSDEEDNVISVDDDDSIAAENEVGIYAGISSVYVCPSPAYAPISSVYISLSSPVNVPSTPTSSAAANKTEPDNTICIDDDD